MASKFHTLVTTVLGSYFARLTASIPQYGFDNNTITRLELGNSFTHFLNYAAELVAKCHRRSLPGQWMRRAWLWNQILPAQKLVQIGSADAAERRFDLSSMFQKQLPALFYST